MVYFGFKFATDFTGNWKISMLKTHCMASMWLHKQLTIEDPYHEHQLVLLVPEVELLK